jgi:hypothetical protein
MYMTKKRNDNTATEIQGVNALRVYCAQNNLIFQAESREDFGIDCYIEVAVEKSPKNFLIGVQCKAGPSYKESTKDDGSFSVRVRLRDLNYWAAANYPVIFAYYDVAVGTLYYKHVQKELEGLRFPSPLVFNFTKNDAASSDSNAMAEYVRKLVAMTPSFFDRLELLNNGLSIVATGSIHQVHQDNPMNELLSLSEAIQPAGRDEFCLEESTVLGYSPDDRWILQIVVTHLGQKCTEYHALFLDTKDWGQFIAPIYMDQDHDADRNPSVKDCAERLADIQEWIERLNICPGRMVYVGLKYYSDLDKAPNENPVFCWGTQRFSLACRRLYNRDVLVLENNGFVPVRSVHLAMEGIGLAPLFETFDGNLWAEEQRTRMGHVAAISLSASGKTLSITTMTNQSNACFGEPVLRVFHYPVDELRDLCIDALRV